MGLPRYLENIKKTLPYDNNYVIKSVYKLKTLSGHQTYYNAKAYILRVCEYSMGQNEERKKNRMNVIRKKLYVFKNKDYGVRIYPKKLKYLILERDNFQCQICGIHKNNLKNKEHLEIDHIIEWEDGGKTTYNNGQTICSGCNKGKHHAKIEKKKIKNMFSPFKAAKDGRLNKARAISF